MTNEYPYRITARLMRSTVTSREGTLPREELLEYISTAEKLYELSIQNAETIRELKRQLHIAHAEIRFLEHHNSNGEIK